MTAPGPPGEPSALDHLRALRRSGRLDDARRWLGERLRGRPDQALLALAWQHEPFWWQPLRGRRVSLHRRGPDDIDLVRRCWADADFMRKFNRMAAPLPAADEALRDLLRREQAAIVSETAGLHWTIHAGEHKLGFVSVTNIALGHRRAEYLIGIHEACSPWVGPEASHLALGFLARQAHIERLTAYYYPENAHAIEVSQKLGFVIEGTMRGFLRLADGSRSDLVVAGLLLDDAYFART
ncbi:GNAT family N-acetyltransferase, partial [Aquabacterium sp.]|uniref:GNAT family N-acetyltransferase n=1 Tax=Aquabacterium sp. TaxID=1872578 RepID=UPI002BD25213